ncbi:hypothetical protein DM872_26025 [Pseudomonas taiwanensis]|nr:hypothetical protein [Pseudomonas taiwanensis]
MRRGGAIDWRLPLRGWQLLRIVVDQQPILRENRSPNKGCAVLLSAIRRYASGPPVNANCPPLQRLTLTYDGDRIGLDL